MQTKNITNVLLKPTNKKVNKFNLQNMKLNQP